MKGFALRQTSRKSETGEVSQVDQALVPSRDPGPSAMPAFLPWGLSWQSLFCFPHHRLMPARSAARQVPRARVIPISLKPATAATTSTITTSTSPTTRPATTSAAAPSCESKATENLCSFNLDLLGFDVKRIKVRNQKASWSRDGQELTVTPEALRKGSGFALSVRYSGVPVDFRDPTFGIPIGFTPTSDGAIAVGQPESAATWFPVNDHPSDKASYDVRRSRRRTVTASSRTEGREARSPASPVGPSGAGRRRRRWRHIWRRSTSVIGTCIDGRPTTEFPYTTRSIRD